jgi:FkbM family methyltransferase
MFAYIKRKLERRKLKRTRAIYGFDLKTFNLGEFGDINFAQWKNPFDWRIPFTTDLMDFYKNYIKKGDLVIDIGANTGDTTVPLALAAGKEGLAIGFDPNPMVFNILLENSKLNTDKYRILPVNAAITDTEGEFYYNSSEATFSNGGISATPDGKHGKYTLDNKIKGIKLSKYLNENHSELLEKLSFIKIDAEGYDKDIIKSISDLIEKYKPYIITECFKYLKKEERIEFYDLIISKGYKLYFLDGFYIKPLLGKQIQKDDMIINKTFDIFAMPVEK